MKRTLNILTILLFLSSCKHSYDINNERIKLSYRIDHGFGVYQLDVKQYDTLNYPYKYEKKLIAFCTPNYSPSRDRIEKELPISTLMLYDYLWEKHERIMDSLIKIDSKYRIINSTDTTEAVKFIFSAGFKRDSIIKEYFPFKPNNTIYFKKKNKFYWWSIDYRSSDLEIFPIDFEKEIWYKIEFSNQSCYTDDYYFKFDINNKIITNHIEGNCGAPW